MIAWPWVVVLCFLCFALGWTIHAILGGSAD